MPGHMCNTYPVYPRSRGELLRGFAGLFLAFGLSPLARGTHQQTAFHKPVRRFIPARAGNSSALNACTLPRPVYPRSRGELSLPLIRNAPTTGLSPLARGTPGIPTVYRPGTRFIPARAGNSVILGDDGGRLAVYPRSRGELRGTGKTTRYCDGLSPLARGTRHNSPKRFLRFRFIPARAGNSDLKRVALHTPPVYPRSRGELVTVGVTLNCWNGLSPLARGTRSI